MSILPQSLRQSLTQWAASCPHWLPTASCLLCEADSGQEILCRACAADLPRLPETRCPRCAAETTFGEHCGPCQKSPRHFEQVQALFTYDFPCDRLIQALKYGHQLTLAGWLGHQLATRCQLPNADLLIPMPMHADRLRERGFNQAVEIARAISRHTGITLASMYLQRTRATQAQAGLRPEERRRNIRGAFACNTDLSGKHILLIDDVLTTGASADECARVLKLHGADTVTVAVVARALKH